MNTCVCVCVCVVGMPARVCERGKSVKRICELLHVFLTAQLVSLVMVLAPQRLTFMKSLVQFVE